MKNLIKIDDNFLSKKSKKFINEVVLAPGIFPYYSARAHPYKTKENTYKKFMGHIILSRPDTELLELGEIDKIDPTKAKTPAWNSPYHIQFIDMVNEFCEKQKIKIKKFYRMSVNCTYNNGHEATDIHTDHDFPHHQIIIYLNDAEDKNAETVILNNKNKVIKRIKPIQYQGICFKCLPHYLKFPKFGQRVVLVATFKKGK